MNKRRRRVQKGRGIKKSKKVDTRVNSLMVGVVVVALIVVGRLFNVQVLSGSYYSALASGQHQIYEDLTPSRGEIYIQDKFSKNLIPLVVNKKMFLAYAVPQAIEDPLQVAHDISGDLEMETEDLLVRLSKENDVYEPLKKEVSEEVRDRIVEKNIKGIGFSPVDVRYYTENQFAAHLLGFVGFDGDVRKGRYGLEGYYDDALSGKKGFLAAEKDALGKFVIGGTELFEEAENGTDIVLTIDRVIQYKVEKILKQATEDYGAEKGTVIVMNPNNGEIIALANYPDFNPNTYNEVEDVGVFTNSAIFDLYEPGSTFKPIITAAAVNAGLISPHTIINDTGAVDVDEYTIKNSDFAANGNITTTEALEKSSNVAMVAIGQMLGRDRLYEYLERFGFTELTGVDINSEAQTNISKPSTWADSDLATISFGQGIAITPLRLVNATAAIANGGKLVKPHVIQKKKYANGDEELTDTSFAREVISKTSAETVASMMVSVVENGNGKPAQIPGYKIAGKTGTAQVVKKGSAGYDPDQKITTFTGFGPVDDPQFVMLVKFNNPGGDVWGATTAAPVFKQIAEELITYYQIPPTEKE